MLATFFLFDAILGLFRPKPGPGERSAAQYSLLARRFIVCSLFGRYSTLAPTVQCHYSLLEGTVSQKSVP